MPHVTAYYKLIVSAGHHRQPRNTGGEEDLAPSSGSDVPAGGSFSPPYFPSLPCPTDSSETAKLLFWSVTDGTTGQVLPPAAFTQTVDGSSLTITGWYVCTGGGGTGKETEIIDDAFSANLGGFIDDTFVNVTSDPSLTNDANVVGIVPTNVAETLVAQNHVVSTTEPFYKWVLNGVFGLASDTTLNVAQGTDGIAIAIYESPPGGGRFRPPYFAAYNPWWWVETWWGHGPDPAPEIVRELAAVVELVGAANAVSPQIRARTLQIALEQVRIAASTIEKQIQELQGK